MSQEPDKPRVSVVIPTHRWREYLPMALESVFAQTFTDYEVIVVNDGSPDDVAAALRALIDAGRIRYVEQENGGTASARNRGLAEAKGEFVAFMDDDDLWPADSLEWRVAALEKNEAALLVYGGVTFVEGEAEPDSGAGIFPGDGGPEGDVYEEFLSRNWLYSPGQALTRTEVVRGIGGFDKTLWGIDDYDFYIRLAKLGPFIYIPRRALYYRKHAGNTSKNLWRMYCNVSRVRRMHLGFFPTPKNWRVWLANYRFWTGVFSVEFVAAAQAALGNGDKKAARQMWWFAVRATPQLLRKRQFLTLGLALR